MSREFDVGAQLVAVVAASDFDRFEAGRLHVLEDEVFVVVLAFQFEFDFDQVTACDFGQVDELFTLVLLDALVDDLAAGAGGFGWSFRPV